MDVCLGCGLYHKECQHSPRERPKTSTPVIPCSLSLTGTTAGIKGTGYKFTVYCRIHGVKTELIQKFEALTVAKAELGTKRTDPDTGKKFYDLNRDPVVSPYTGKSWPLSFFEETTAQAKMEQAEEEDVQEVDTESTDVELVSLEDADGDNTNDEVPDDIGDDDVELDDDDDTFLEADEDDDDDDVSGIIGVGGDDEES